MVKHDTTFLFENCCEEILYSHVTALTTDCVKLVLSMLFFCYSYYGVFQDVLLLKHNIQNTPIPVCLKANVTHLKGNVTSFPAGLQTPRPSSCHTIPTTFYFQSILLLCPMLPSKPVFATSTFLSFYAAFTTTAFSTTSAIASSFELVCHSFM
jgi:hypothetical protein